MNIIGPYYKLRCTEYHYSVLIPFIMYIDKEDRTFIYIYPCHVLNIIMYSIDQQVI